jgi:tRNA(Ile)-lysidine synthase
LLEVGREELRTYIQERDGAVADQAGNLWREDATNADTDRFRAFVRHEIIPVAKQRNPKLLETLTRTMNLIAEEDDMLAQQARTLLIELGQPLGYSIGDGVLLSPKLADEAKPLIRRVLYKLLGMMLPADDRVEAASVEACVEGLGKPGYSANIQGNLAVSYNKEGLRLEPMEAYRARRNRM